MLEFQFLPGVEAVCHPCDKRVKGGGGGATPRPRGGGVGGRRLRLLAGPSRGLDGRALASGSGRGVVSASAGVAGVWTAHRNNYDTKIKLSTVFRKSGHTSMHSKHRRSLVSFN